jgi:hypothetical protein
MSTAIALIRTPKSQESFETQSKILQSRLHPAPPVPGAKSNNGPLKRQPLSMQSINQNAIKLFLGSIAL